LVQTDTDKNDLYLHWYIYSRSSTNPRIQNKWMVVTDNQNLGKWCPDKHKNKKLDNQSCKKCLFLHYTYNTYSQPHRIHCIWNSNYLNKNCIYRERQEHIRQSKIEILSQKNLQSCIPLSRWGHLVRANVHVAFTPVAITHIRVYNHGLVKAVIGASGFIKII
jgi:hypothetical protein